MHQDSDTPSVKGKNYAEFSREELIAEINRLKKSKKYGLVWEHKTEEVIENFKKGAQPYLKEVDDKRLELAPGEPTNLIIEGDNFDALSILNYTHAGKIDVIYIDPPYNTGNKDFIYNDNYVDSEDTFRHSKWLSFMEPRLRLARNLLKDDGVLFISIDDNELSSLKIRCDEIFGFANYVSILPRITKKSGKDHSEGVAKNNDFVLVYAKDKCRTVFNGISSSDDDYPLKDEYFEERGGYKLNQTLDYDSLWYNPKMDFPIECEGKIFYPGGKEQDYLNRHEGQHKAKDWVWRWSFEKFQFGLKNGFVVIKKGKERPRIYTKTYANATISNTRPYRIEYKVRETKLSSVGLIDNQFSNDNAKKEITKIGFEEFGFPKPTSLIKQLLRICEKQDIVLDFFAGSGTTGQAALELNKEDGGHRQFILCTNNGDKGPDSTKIAEDITYPRIKTVITGERQDGSKYSDGIPANLRYYKIDHRQKKDSVDATRQDIVNYLEDIIKIKENTFKPVEANEDFSLYQNSEQYLSMVFDPFSLEEVIEKLTVANADKRPVKLYVFSYSRDAFEEDFGTDFEIEFVAMPEGLLKTYANIIEDLKKEDA